MKKKALIILLGMMITGCNLLVSPTSTPSPTQQASPTESPIPAATSAPSETASIEPSLTPTQTETDLPPSQTEPPTISPTPSVTPAMVPAFRSDSLQLVDLPENVRDGIANPLIVFTNSNDQQSIANIATAEAENTVEVLYFTPPGSRSRIKVAELNSSTDDQIYLAENGKALAFFQPGGSAPGLYVLNIVTDVAFINRIYPATSLVQRGIFSKPVWTSDGEYLAVVLQTSYALDIFLYSRDGSQRTNLTEAGSYDFWPAFSPDGRFMAFVSDRANCTSWNPEDPEFCDYLTDEPPYGGTVHLMNLETQAVRQVSDAFVTEAPYWINDQLLVIVEGDQTNLLSPERKLWVNNINTGQQTLIGLDGDDSSVRYLSDTWSPDGVQVLVQRISGSDTSIVLMQTDGTLIAERGEELTFPRFGLKTDWSPIEDRIVIGGVGGRCPYGIRVADSNDFGWVATGNQPAICDPIFSPTGGAIAFTGITSAVDGRLDIYSSSADGFGIQNLTGDLRGTMNLIGWIGGQP